MSFLDVMLFKDIAPMGMVSNPMTSFALPIMILMLVVFVGLYVFVSLAYMSIAKKIGKTSPTGISWIPGFGPLVVSWHASGMSWLSWLLVPVFYVFYTLAIFSLPIMMLGGSLSTGLIVLGILIGITGLTFLGFISAWSYKMFKALGRPGWWGLMHLVPIVGFLIVALSPIVGVIVSILGIIAWFVFLGIAAWGSAGNNNPVTQKSVNSLGNI